MALAVDRQNGTANGDLLQLEQVNRAIETYGRKKASLIPILQRIQEIYHYLPEDILTYVAEGEKLHLELQRIQIGAFRDAVTYLVEGPSGIVMAQGELTRGDNETQQISIAVPAGVYSVRIEAGSGAVSLASSNRHVVTEASQKSPMNIIGRVRPLTFHVPEQTTSFNLHLKASARETVRLVMHDPQGDTVIDDVFDREVTVNFDASGRAGIWNLQLLRAPVGIFEDVEQIYLEGVPPYFSEAAERLLVPSENLH
jgi:hypothetical protein